MSTKIHGVLDYLVSALLIASPWIFNFAGSNYACYVPVAVGIIGILYSLLTDYEWGLIKTISMPMHLAFDLAAGVGLAASPWLFGFNRAVHSPHLFIGLLIICVSLLSNPVPYKKRSGNVVEQGFTR